jgi:hypothetical protein
LVDTRQWLRGHEDCAAVDGEGRGRVSKVADRTWEFLRWDDEWTRVIAMDATTLVLASGEAVWWRRCELADCADGCGTCRREGTWLPSTSVRVRYSVPIRDPEGSLVPMPWRKGYLDGLAQDMGHPEVTARIRDAQAAERQRGAIR